MRKPKPIARNWPSPEELAAVDHGIRELVARLEPMQAERIRQHREHLRLRLQRIMEAIFRARSRAGDCPARAEIRARTDGPDLVVERRLNAISHRVKSPSTGT